LAYVPTNAGVFAHLRVGELWNSPLLGEIRKAAAKDIDKALAAAEKEIGIRPDAVDTVTFFYPTMPMGPGDEQAFVVIVTTNKPYDKNTLLKNVRKKDAKEKDGLVPLTDKLLLSFTNERTFMVLHEAHLEKFKKGPLGDQKPGVMSEALKLAGQKHHFVFAMDFSQLPNELFTAAPPELKPFLPLLKTKSSTLFGDLKDKEIKFGLNFVCENGDSAQDAERSFKLLMQLASDGLAEILKDPKYLKEVGPLLPGLRELERGVKNVKQKRDGSRLEIAMDLKADMPIAEMVTQTIKKITDESSRAQASNNMKQVALAMHNYHDTFNGFPSSAICDKKGKPLLSWRVSILPFIEQQELYKEFKLDEPWDSENNKKLIAKMPKTYALPNQKAADGKTHFRLFTGNGAVFDMVQQSKIQDIPDGTSNTVMVVESAEPTIWSKPDDIEYDDKLAVEKLLRFVDAKTMVAFCDGSVRFLKKGLAEKTWHYLIQKNDGNPIPDLDE
jgi:hypothetical protein